MAEVQVLVRKLLPRQPPQAALKLQEPGVPVQQELRERVALGRQELLEPVEQELLVLAAGLRERVALGRRELVALVERELQVPAGRVVTALPELGARELPALETSRTFSSRRRT